MAVIEFVKLGDSRGHRDDQGREFIELTLDQLLTPLVLAARVGDAPAVAAMLAAGADPNAPDTNGERPLHSAGSPEITRLLAEHGADTSRGSGEGLSPLEVRWTSSEEVVLALLDAGANPNTRLPNGAPLLLEAIRKLQRRVVAAFLRYGADPTAEDDEGVTLPATVQSLDRSVERPDRGASSPWRDVSVGPRIGMLFVLSIYGLAPRTTRSGVSWLVHAAERLMAFTVAELLEFGGDPMEPLPVADRLESRRLELAGREHDVAAHIELQFLDETRPQIAKVLAGDDEARRQIP